jgi:hypothetical protein
MKVSTALAKVTTGTGKFASNMQRVKNILETKTFTYNTLTKWIYDITAQ